MLLPHMVRQGQSRVYSSTILLSQPSYKIDRNCVWRQCCVGRVHVLAVLKMVRADLVRVVRFAIFEPRSPGLVCMTHFLDLLKHNDVAAREEVV